MVFIAIAPSFSKRCIDSSHWFPYDILNWRQTGAKEDGMSRNKLAAIIVVCTIAIIAAIVLFSLKPWEGTREETPSIETYTLTTTVSPSGTGFVCPSSDEYESGEQVTLIVSPANGYAFDHWNGDASGNSTTITITIDRDYSITANFAYTALHPLTLVSPERGATGVHVNNPGFSWDLAAEADEFYFVLSANRDLSVPIVEVGLTQPYYQYSEEVLDYATTYYWQVTALGGGSIIASSTISVFRTYEVCEPG